LHCFVRSIFGWLTNLSTGQVTSYIVLGQI
jgi:hypothetical protein